MTEGNCFAFSLAIALIVLLDITVFHQFPFFLSQELTYRNVHASKKSWWKKSRHPNHPLLGNTPRFFFYGSFKSISRLPNDPAILHPDIYPGEMKIHVHTKACT